MNRLERITYWMDTKLARLLHLPKPFDWEEFYRLMEKGVEEEMRKRLVELEKVRQESRGEVANYANQFAGIKHNPEWKSKLKEWGIKIIE